jgi:hypothetical protein
MLDSGVNLFGYNGKLELCDLTFTQVDNGYVTAIYWYSDDEYSADGYKKIYENMSAEYGEAYVLEEGSNNNVLGLLVLCQDLVQVKMRFSPF